MAEDRILTSYYFVEKSKSIHMKRAKGDEVIEDKLVAHYDPETAKVSFKNKAHTKLYKTPVMTFLAENELSMRSFVREDLPADKPATASTPPRPKKTKHDGDKTPAVVEWYRRYFPNEYITRYGIMGKYTGIVLVLVPNWEPRPVDGTLEYRGESKVEKKVENVDVATRAIVGKNGERLTYTPDECQEWDEDDPEAGDEESVASGRFREEGEDE